MKVFHMPSARLRLAPAGVAGTATGGNPAALPPVARWYRLYPVMMAEEAAVLASSSGPTTFDGATTKAMASTASMATFMASPRIAPEPSRLARAYIVNPAVASVQPISGQNTAEATDWV